MHCRLYLVTVCVGVLQNRRLLRFSKRTYCWCMFSWSICNKTATLLGVSRAAVSKVMTTYTNHGRTSSPKRNRDWKQKLSGWDRPTLKRTVTINHRSTAAKATVELNINLKTVSTKTVWQECHKSNIHGRAAIAKPLITENNAIRWKRDHLMIGHTLYGQMSHPSQCYWHQVRFMFGHHPQKSIIVHAWFQLWNMEPDLDDLGSSV